ncbi:MAG: type II CAAX endopeptidase family protein [Gemmatimonadota bacterium]
MSQPIGSVPAARSPSRQFLIALGWSILFFILGYVVTIALAIGYALVFGPVGARLSIFNHTGPEPLLVQGLASIAGFGLATWIIGIRGNRLSLVDLRWKGVVSRGAAFGGGLLIGVAPALLALALAMAVGGARFGPDAGSIADYLRQVGLTLLILAPAALSEEMVFRGVPQVLLSRSMGRFRALILLSVLFAAAHLWNPEVDPIALANIALAGVFLGAAFYLPGGIWTAFGAHLGWNFTLAAADAPVSGLPFTIPWINYLPGGPHWVTGGAFGPEGGLVASVSIALGLTWVIRRIRREDA